jgi:hypothetical protein
MSGGNPGAVASGTQGTPFGEMGGKINNPASYSGGAGKGGGNGGITPQSPNPYMPQGLNRFDAGYRVPRVANTFQNYQPQELTGGLFSGMSAPQPTYAPTTQPTMGGLPNELVGNYNMPGIPENIHWGSYLNAGS